MLISTAAAAAETVTTPAAAASRDVTMGMVEDFELVELVVAECAVMVASLDDVMEALHRRSTNWVEVGPPGVDDVAHNWLAER